MKLVNAFINPACLGDVRAHLEALGVHTLILGQGVTHARGARTQVYRGSTYVIDPVETMAITLVVEDDKAPAIVSVLEERGGDGCIAISPIDVLIPITRRARAGIVESVRGEPAERSEAAWLGRALAVFP